MHSPSCRLTRFAALRGDSRGTFPETFTRARSPSHSTRKVRTGRSRGGSGQRPTALGLARSERPVSRLDPAARTRRSGATRHRATESARARIESRAQPATSGRHSRRSAHSAPHFPLTTGSSTERRRPTAPSTMVRATEPALGAAPVWRGANDPGAQNVAVLAVATRSIAGAMSSVGEPEAPTHRPFSRVAPTVQPGSHRPFSRGRTDGSSSGSGPLQSRHPLGTGQRQSGPGGVRKIVGGAPRHHRRRFVSSRRRSSRPSTWLKSVGTGIPQRRPRRTRW
jgi:hypothetical protein